jgi:hypothetical protein
LVHIVLNRETSGRPSVSDPPVVISFSLIGSITIFDFMHFCVSEFSNL